MNKQGLNNIKMSDKININLHNNNNNNNLEDRSFEEPRIKWWIDV